MPNITFPSTQRVDFEWRDGTPAEINYKLAKISRLFDPPYGFLNEAKAILRMDMRERFETETDPEGNPWQELVKPEDEQIGILRRGSTDAQMYRDATSDRAWDTSPAGIFFDTSALPHYWAHHEQPDRGAYRIPRRSFIGASESAQREITEYAAYWLEQEVYEIISEPTPMGIFSPRTGMQIATAGQTTTDIRGIARRQVHDPATGRFVSTII